MAITHLAYISLAAPDVDDAGIASIVATSRENNRRDAITGFLQYRDGYFFQVLEGPTQALQHLLERLATDPRHSGMRVLFHEPTSQRTFADWGMGYGGSPAKDAGSRRLLESLRLQGSLKPSHVLALFLDLLDPLTALGEAAEAL